MKKNVIFSLVLTGGILAMSCNKMESAKEERTDLEANATVKRECGSMEVLNAQLHADPQLQQRMNDIEAFTQRVSSNEKELNTLLPDGTIEIPVVVNVIYKTAAQNISDAQIQSQIDVLNEDFGGTNADYGNVPAAFSGVKAAVGVKFKLDKIVRKSSSKSSWGTNDAMKKSSQGGIDPTSPTTKLNMWVVNKMTSGGQTILGYAQFPGGSAATDGVVIGYNFFGRVGTVSAPFNKGRTATHEVGHWLNLRHIWGDAACGSDLVNDTPTHNTANFGCPSYPHLSTCSGTPVEMTMNYMDYTDDACMYMFSAGQKTRALAVFAAGGPRNSFAQPAGVN
ncbi:zinc metalloprotease [Solitalea canadensis]|uniref:Pregnancy-associated plasma protein-A n=1 Tax=Solitalea canadensis (strain ATCC 29591 / DSM 3403 / JCM 21819 / LMG 8368 / NBRC 15130 / NCIMB 12057 / USAM 9D) TaxID=929556 RepID=H8KP42_SOLCM|nr:zinc metalloprotease [Solitalea canadensis]AFD05679.1 Pregnancy-associated plasma protein-A [Solitalea canadensis DSM 3403]